MNSRILRVGGYCNKGLHFLASEKDIYTKPSSKEQNCRKCRFAVWKRNYTANKDKYLQRSKQWAKANPDLTTYRARSSHLRRNFGLSQEDYTQMVLRQNGKCLICGNTPEASVDRIGRDRGKLHIDHCHNTNKIRGLLCHNCNVGLGNFQEDREILVKAIKYLEYFDGKS